MSEAAVQTEGETEAPVEKQNIGLLDLPEAQPDEPAEPVKQDEPVKTEENTEWYWSDDQKGSGSKPEWLKERYKSVADQAKAYTDLEKKFGEFKGAPKEGYDLEKIEGLQKDSPLLKHFTDVFKDMNLSQSGFEKVVNEFVNSQSNIIETDAMEEMKKLGPDGTKMLQQTNLKVQNNFPPEVAKTIQSWVMTAEDVKALDTLLAYMPHSKVPSTHDMQSTQVGESYKEIVNEKTMNWGKYQEDVNYRTSLDRRMQSAQRREANQKALQSK